MKERVYLWDNIKVFLMLLVVCTHSVCIYQNEGWIEYYWVFIMTYTMPLFMLVSGFWFKKKEIKKIIIRFLWPCLLFSVVNFAWGSLFYEPYKNATPKTFLCFGYAMWYLWALFLYYLFTPLLVKYLRLKVLFFLSVIGALLIGFVPFVGVTFQLSRVICFYPFFALGMLFKEHEESLKKIPRGYKWFLCLLVLSLFYMIADYICPGVVYKTGFTGGFGLSLKGLILRAFTYLMCIAMCFCVIYAMPDRKFWFSKYGNRTMNVYLLHMIIVFPCTWYIGALIKDTWYGHVFLIVCVPLLCMVLFSEKVDRVMRKILLLKS